MSPLISPVPSEAPASVPALPGDERRLPDDATLVRRALTGDSWAEEALYRRHVRGLSELVTRLLARSAEAEDAVQDSFVTAFTDLAQLRDPAAFRPWLYRIGVRQVHRRFRRRRLRRALGLDTGGDDATLAQLVDDAADPELRTELARLDNVLSTLRSADRTSWMLRYVEGYRYTEIAGTTECSVATAKRRVERALARIRAVLCIEVKEAFDD